MAAERAQQPACVGIPYPDLPVVFSGEDPLAVAGGHESRTGAYVALELSGQGFPRDVPYPQSLGARNNQLATAWTERQGHDLARRSGCDRARSRCPDSTVERTVSPARGELLAVVTDGEGIGIPATVLCGAGAPCPSSCPTAAAFRLDCRRAMIDSPVCMARAVTLSSGRDPASQGDLHGTACQPRARGAASWSVHAWQEIARRG